MPWPDNHTKSFVYETTAVSIADAAIMTLPPMATVSDKNALDEPASSTG